VQPALFDAPAVPVLPWVWPHLEALRHRPGGVCYLVAGEEGAVLLACREPGPSETSSDAGAESPASGGGAALLSFAVHCAAGVGPAGRG
jgi:hypothetical protein